MQKRDRSKRRRVHLQLDDLDLPMLPAQITIANLLPADVEAPDWGTPDAPETELQKFLDERFPREMFLEFRRMVDGPSLIQMSARKQGVETAAAPQSRLANYRYIVETRRMWRAAARINSLVAVMAGERRPLLRICEWRQCQKLFVAERNNQKWCSDKCGAASRQARKRDKAKQYELQRELNISAKKTQRRKPKKGASR
jgi:hypothetical protein